MICGRPSLGLKCPLKRDDRLGPVSLGPQFLSYFPEQVLLAVFLLRDLLDADAINSRCSTVEAHFAPRCMERVPVHHSAIQTVKAELGFLFGLLSQLLSPSGESGRQDRFPEGLFSHCLFRARTFIVQSVLRASDSACCHCGPLAPRSLPVSQLLRAAPTPAPARLPIICSQLALACPFALPACAGLSCS